MDAIVTILNHSESCRQYIRATCFNTHIYDNDGDHTAYWVSRQGVVMPNWGNAPSDVVGCLCGINRTCHYSVDALCNCYRSSDMWLTDDGYLTDRDRLPVTRLHFGDTGGSNEKMKFELGFLECE
ncbi:contactin-associated protein-like 5 [Lytechinus pictus]|uniref:contactin-associated protein-like 5 n=1 Tax=Lytechinus pictus TaxID=7653 RepID=UPI00240E8429|nr:contactin-associated protein-like 5 [Lytechinus pictus]